MNSIDWGRRKVSSFSDGANNCVEAAHGQTGPVIGVWDTKRRQDGPLVFGDIEWSAFLTDVKAGRFDG